MSEAVDTKRMEKLREARMLCDVLRDFIPRACQTDAEVALVNFLFDNGITITKAGT